MYEAMTVIEATLLGLGIAVPLFLLASAVIRPLLHRSENRAPVPGDAGWRHLLTQHDLDKARRFAFEQTVIEYIAEVSR